VILCKKHADLSDCSRTPPDGQPVTAAGRNLLDMLARDTEYAQICGPDCEHHDFRARILAIETEAAKKAVIEVATGTAVVVSKALLDELKGAAAAERARVSNLRVAQATIAQGNPLEPMDRLAVWQFLQRTWDDYDDAAIEASR
jgi:hypothetical protein